MVALLLPQQPQGEKMVFDYFKIMSKKVERDSFFSSLQSLIDYAFFVISAHLFSVPSYPSHASPLLPQNFEKSQEGDSAFQGYEK